jgi:hypothetical protein
MPQCALRQRKTPFRQENILNNPKLLPLFGSLYILISKKRRYQKGFPEHMADAFELYAFDYLVKPFKPERIRQTAKKIFKSVTANRKVINLNYVERLVTWGAKSHQVSMKFTNETGLVSNSVIKELERRLSGRTS